jgi:dTMP kinase
MMQKVIVFEGIDGCGKETQYKAISKRLEREGYAYTGVDYPCYGTIGGDLVKYYLNGEISENVEEVNAYAASTMYAIDRYIDYMKNWREKDGIVLANRYTTSNLLFQLAKLNESEWDSFEKWLTEFEYTKLGLPMPTAVIYLHIAPDCARKQMEKRYKGDLTKEDIHEKNVMYMSKVAHVSEYVAKAQGWIWVECQNVDGEMRAREEITAEILTKIKDIL